MKLPTFLFIKMRKGHWSLLLHMRDPKIRKKATEVYYFIDL